MSPPLMLVQKRLLAREELISSVWRTASVRPASPKLAKSKLNVVTIVTNPKSAGPRILARMSILMRLIAKTEPWANTVIPAFRTVDFDNSAFSVGPWNFPVASNGCKLTSFLDLIFLESAHATVRGCEVYGFEGHGSSIT